MKSSQPPGQNLFVESTTNSFTNHVKVVTAGILRREDETILLVRRAPGEKLSGYWEFPGGKVEPDETDQ